MMRVLHVIGPMTVGGAQTQLLGLLEAANGVHWDATLCATAPGPMIDDFRAAGVTVLELDRSRSAVGRMLQLRGIVRRGGFDVVHANLWSPNAYARAAVLGRRRRPAVVISERNVEVDRSRWQRAVDRLLAPSTDVFVGNSEAVCDFIRASHPVRGRRVVHIANAVDTSIFRPGDVPRAPGFRVGSVGRLFPEKGFAVLIDAVRLVAPEIPSLSLEVVGVGPLRSALEDQARGLPVRFVGALSPGAEVAHFLRSLDVFVLPSTHREGRANVVLEALACGIPSIVTGIPGMDETVGSAATVVPPGSAEAIADALRAHVRGHAPARPRGAVEGFDQLAASYRAVFDGCARVHAR
jgi:glycosyltransferase involved in cell wall biosynthesis